MERNIHSPLADRRMSVHTTLFGDMRARIQVDSVGSYERDGVGQFIYIDKRSAQELYVALTEIFGDITPPTVTFQSQFAELAVGDQFSATNLSDPRGAYVTKAVKIDANRYYSYTGNRIKVAAMVNAGLLIRKEG